jgi:heat shock protein HtpX
MQYVGIQTQKERNNFKSWLLLFLFPILVLGLTIAFYYLLYYFNIQLYTDKQQALSSSAFVFPLFIRTAPWVIGGVLIWFLIAYFANTQIISNATHSRPLNRKDNKRVYNLVENLCISQGMDVPKINVINDSSLNAFASGINKKSYTVTLTTGIIDQLDDAELEAVIAHELSHIRNHDVRLLIVSIVFVGIFSFLAQLSLRVLFHAPKGSRNKKGGGGVIPLILLVVVLAFVGYLFSTLMRFAISRNREYMADAGSAEMTKNPLALAGALRKISEDPSVEVVTSSDVAQLFIENPSKRKNVFALLFASHPPVAKRIKLLEQF